jgi:hypothetical protein
MPASSLATAADVAAVAPGQRGWDTRAMRPPGRNRGDHDGVDVGRRIAPTSVHDPVTVDAALIGLGISVQVELDAGACLDHPTSAVQCVE